MSQKTDYAEQLLTAAKIIADQAISEVKFDKTLLCSIISIDNENGDEYTVSDGSTKFTAYGDTGYKIDTNVYVLIPNGDYNNRKIIVGKYVSSDTESFTYVSPMDNFLQLTDNLYDGEEGQLLANDEVKEISLGVITIPTTVAIGFDRLGISADFKTNLTQYNVISGSYGIRLHVIWKETNSSDNAVLTHSNDVYLNTTDMWGNPYNYNTYFTQEKVFDISKISTLVSIEVFFYQNQDFVDANNTLIPHSTILANNEEVDYQKNLFANNIIISLGHSLDDLKEDKVFLYSSSSLNYNQATSIKNNKAHAVSHIYTDNATLAGNEKKLHLRWVHKINDTTFKAIDEDSELPSDCRIHWYRYTLNKDITDALAGMFWEEITPANDRTLDATFLPDETEQTEQLKAIIVKTDEAKLETILNTYSDANLTALINSITTKTNSLTTAKEKKILYDNRIKTGQTVDSNTYDDNEKLISSLTKELEGLKEEYNNWEANKASAIREQCQSVYESEVLTFTNTDLVADKATIDLVKGLEISALDTYNGIYKIYDPLSAYLTNTTEASKTRKVQVKFTSVITGTADLDKAETIKWYIPKSNTMIQTPVNGIEYDTTNGDKFDYESNGKYYIITRDFEGNLVKTLTGELVDRSAVQTYRIEKYFNENKNNNVIKCEVIRNNITYKTEKELIFGLSGSNGRDATLILAIGNDYDDKGNIIETNAPAWTFSETVYGDKSKAKATSKLQLVARIFDYNNKELDISSCTWSYHQPATKRPFAINADNTLTLNSNEKFSNYQGCILHCEAYANGKRYDGYLPIPVRTTRFYKYLEGATSVIYNSQGASPSYYKDYYKLYNNLEQPFDNVSVARFDSWLDEDEAQWLPTVKNKEDDDKYYILPNTLFMDDIPYCTVFGVFQNSTCRWKQPILVMENRYSSPMLNNWDGKLTMDEENGTILSAMMGAGKKNSDNTFSGVLIGDTGKVEADGTSNGKTGVYGYYHGLQSFGLKEDGTSFLGQATTARLEFDGDKGTIQNAGYAGGTGIKMFLDGKTEHSQYISLKNGDTEYVRLSTGKDTGDTETYLQVNGLKSDNSKVTLLKVGNKSNGYYLQSANFSGNGTGPSDSGMKIDLVNGNIMATNFSLGATNKIGGWTITGTTISAGNTTLNSDGTIDTQQLYAHGGGTIGGWEISDTTISSGGTTLNSNGTVTCNELIAINKGTIGPYTIDSANKTLKGNGVILGSSKIKIGNDLTIYTSGDVGFIDFGTAYLRSDSSAQTIACYGNFILYGTNGNYKDAWAYIYEMNGHCVMFPFDGYIQWDDRMSGYTTFDAEDAWHLHQLWQYYQNGTLITSSTFNSHTHNYTAPQVTGKSDTTGTPNT